MVNKNNKLYVLEANTMPGMTEQSLYPKSAAVNGMSMAQLVDKFIDMVKRDYNL
jgi:D-alanine-D-alanine ligase